MLGVDVEPHQFPATSFSCILALTIPLLESKTRFSYTTNLSSRSRTNNDQQMNINWQTLSECERPSQRTVDCRPVDQHHHQAIHGNQQQKPGITANPFDQYRIHDDKQQILRSGSKSKSHRFLSKQLLVTHSLLVANYIDGRYNAMHDKTKQLP